MPRPNGSPPFLLQLPASFWLSRSSPFHQQSAELAGYSCFNMFHMHMCSSALVLSSEAAASCSRMAWKLDYVSLCCRAAHNSKLQ